MQSNKQQLEQYINKFMYDFEDPLILLDEAIEEKKKEYEKYEQNPKATQYFLTERLNFIAKLKDVHDLFNSLSYLDFWLKFERWLTVMQERKVELHGVNIFLPLEEELNTEKIGMFNHNQNVVYVKR